MVSTRTQDGTINTKTYSPLTLDLNALSLRSPLNSPTTRRNGPRSPSRVLKPGTPRRQTQRTPRTPRTPASARKQKFANTAASQSNAAISTVPASLTSTRTRTGAKGAAEQAGHGSGRKKESDLLERNPFFPSVVIGAKEEVGLSKIGRADKEVKMWEEILAEYEKNMPSLVPTVQQKVWEAKHKRASLDEMVGENWMIGDVSPAESKIKARLECLEWALSTSKFGPETENIKCAIAGYKSGAIGYNEHFTVIYAAQIVDTVATYSEFVRDRNEMLDRYCELHGPGWMWYEPPLKVHPESKPKLMSSVALFREDVWTSLGCWYVTQGFWKRSNYVARLSQAAFFQPSTAAPNFKYHPNDPTLGDCQAQGPRLCFRSILDSGATYPSLHTEDLRSLMIDEMNYAAQSVTETMTANGVITNRLFELFVCVLDNDGCQLVDSNNAVYPLSHTYLGGLCPVAEVGIKLTWDANGVEIAHRLSGILPFLASYVSSTPTRNTLFLGEDRNDVLGSHRIPGQKKWSIEMPPIEPGLPFDRYDNPKIRFIHRKGQIVDEDDAVKEHVSRITFMGGTEREMVVVSDPGTKQWESRADEILSIERSNSRAAAVAAAWGREEEEEEGFDIEAAFDGMVQQIQRGPAGPAPGN